MEAARILLFAFLANVRAEYTELNSFTFGALVPGVRDQLVLYIGEDFENTNASVSSLEETYKPCTDLISKQLFQQCVDCISEKCVNKANADCKEQQSAVPVSINRDALACLLSPQGCALLEVGKKAVKVLGDVAKNVKNVLKKVTSNIKKFIGGLLRPRIRLPRIRIRLPRIRLPRIRLPRIRLPRIRLPRIRLPRIRLPRIRLPRIRFPRIRLPRIRLRIFKRRRRQTTEPTCEELANNPDQACQFFSTQCEACAGLSDTDELQLVERLCGVDFKTVYTELKSQEDRLARLEDIYNLADANVFNITRIQYDVSQYDVKAPGYHGVRVEYTLLGNSTSIVLEDPVNLLNPNDAIPVMSQLLYEDLVP